MLSRSRYRGLAKGVCEIHGLGKPFVTRGREQKPFSRTTRRTLLIPSASASREDGQSLALHRLHGAWSAPSPVPADAMEDRGWHLRLLSEKASFLFSRSTYGLINSGALTDPGASSSPNSAPP